MRPALHSGGAAPARSRDRSKEGAPLTPRICPCEQRSDYDKDTKASKTDTHGTKSIIQLACRAAGPY